MTLGYFLWTVGAALIYTAFKDMSVADLMLNRPGKEEGRSAGSDIQESVTADAGQGVGAGADFLSRGASVSGVANFDGLPVAKWIIPHLKCARKKGWGGKVISGYRTPAESNRACQNMCHAPSCPGTCAGTSSNHGGKRFPGGAVDVTDAPGFAAALRACHAPLKNDLPADRGHFSNSGH